MKVVTIKKYNKGMVYDFGEVPNQGYIRLCGQFGIKSDADAIERAKKINQQDQRGGFEYKVKEVK